MLPRFRAGAFWLFAALFAFSLLLGDSILGPQLRFEAGRVAGLDAWWQPLTGLFTYPEGRLYSVGITLVIQWLIGSRLEALWGTRRYVVFVLVSGVVAYSGTAVASIYVPQLAATSPTGMTPTDAAVLLAFAVAYRSQSMTLPGMSAPVAAPALALICALPVLGSPVFAPGGWTMLVPVAIACAVALLFVRPWRGSGETGKVAQRGGSKKRKNKAGLKLVHSADDLLN